MELISHGSMVHLLPQTLAGLQPHHVDTEHNHFCLHWFCGTIKKTRTRGCPVGCNKSSLRFNVNLILSLVLRCFFLHNTQGEKQICNQRLFLTQMCSHSETHTCRHTIYYLYQQRLKKSDGYPFSPSHGGFKDFQ